MPQIDMSFDGKSSLDISMQSVHEIPGEYLVSWTKSSVLSIEIIKYIVWIYWIDIKNTKY